MDDGWMTYSPIAACHYFTAEGHNEGTWEWWARYDQRMIRACDLLIVLTIEGWERSRGVAAEREYAESLGMPVWGLLPHHAGGYRLDRRAEWAGEARVAGHRTCGNCGLYSCDGKCGKLNMFSCDLKK
jgi:nucleoside 2-deoxyribosyltransferase